MVGKPVWMSDRRMSWSLSIEPKDGKKLVIVQMLSVEASAATGTSQMIDKIATKMVTAHEWARRVRRDLYVSSQTTSEGAGAGLVLCVPGRGSISAWIAI